MNNIFDEEQDRIKSDKGSCVKIAFSYNADWEELETHLSICQDRVNVVIGHGL